MDGGEDGLNFYREIAKNAPRYIADEGYLLLEVGIGQAQEVVKLLDGEFSCEVIKDLQGVDRIIFAKKTKRETV